jgi:murein DD-endopeptidase MepM/ murein hydrolase activator NlpD
MKKTKAQNNIFFSAVLFFILIVFFFPQISRADDCDVLSGEEKEKCEDLQVKIDEYKSIIKRKEQKIEDLQNLINEINSQQTQVEENIRKAKMELMDLNEQIIYLEGEIEDKQKLILYQKNILAGLMQNYYENYQQGELEAIIASENLSSLFIQADYAGQTTLKLGEIMEDLEKNKKSLEEEKNEVEKKKEESENLKIKLEQQNLNLQRTENQKKTLLGETQADKEKYEQLLADVQNEIYGLEAGLSEKADLSSIPPAKGKYFTYPVNPHPISQKYGKTSFSYHYPTGLHNGVDFAISYKKVYAVRDGKVLATGNNGRYAYGKWIAIDHGDGLVTLYGHLSSQSVSKGEKVEEGDTIGISGNTGFSTGPHLHFSVFSKNSFEVVESKKVNGLMLPVGATVDPMRYL